jgi:uncharacterized membrane protein YeaQ/YmgE (transglycosylase-associated protein family)
MGILEEAAGAFAGVEGVKKLDPNAGILTEAAAGIAGAFGAEKLGDLIKDKMDGSEQPAEDQQNS